MKINQLFEKNKDGLLNIFYTAGYPEIDSTVKIAQFLANSGVKLIEIGMPFSDPLADGPTIQHSSEVALKNGLNMDVLFKQVEEISRTTDLTVILMGYFNQLMTVGVENFLSKCKNAGVRGLIIPDLPLEIYEMEYQQLFNQYEIDISFLITPRTRNKRIILADKLSSGFLYLVADNSITGASSGTFSEEQVAYFKRISQMNLSSPLLIGFGIKSRNQYKISQKHANGAIIGSEFIRQLSSIRKIDQNTITRFIDSVLQD